MTVPTERIEIAQVIEGHDMYLELRKGKATVRFNKQEAVMVARLLEANAGILPDSPAPEE